MIVSIGEILFDRFPNGKRMGGAPFNFAFHTHALGFETRFISRVGKESNGEEILSFLKANGFDAEYIQMDEDHKTGEVIVTVKPDGSASFDIVRDVAYDHITYSPDLSPMLSRADLIYYGTLIQRTDHGFQNVQKMLADRGEKTRTLYDVNLRPDCYNRKIVEASLDQCHILKLNDEELPVIRGLLSFGRGDDAFIEHLFGNYPIEMICLTLGGAGSRLYTESERVEAEPEKDLKIVDTVGAGDAFTSVLAIGILKGWPPKKTLETATRFASKICRIQGAIPESQDFYRDFSSIFS